MALAHVMHVARIMRPLDIAGIRAFLGDIEPDELAVDRWSTNGPAWSVIDSGVPVAVGGLTFTSEWSAVAWFIASQSMRSQSWRKAVAHTRTVLAKAADPSFEHYKHRIEANVLADRPEAQRYAKHLGFVYEGTRRAAGRHGEDMQVWAIVGPVKGSENG